MTTELHPDVIRLVSDSGPLLRASGVAGFAERQIRSLQMEFTSGVLHLSCDDDTDEIVVEVGERLGADPSDAQPALADLTGLSVEYVWGMTNHRGYFDAFQLRLTDRAGRCETRQVEVAASRLNVLRVVG